MKVIVRRPTSGQSSAWRFALIIRSSLLLASSAAVAVPPEWAQKWSNDLSVVAEEIRAIHPNPFSKIDEARFDAELQELAAELSRLEHHEIVARLATIVALIGDGHTRLTLPLADGVEFFQGHSRTPPSTVPGLAFRAYPIRVAVVDDDLYVHKTTVEHQDMLGGRILRFGELSPADAIAAVSPTIRHDNSLQLLNLLPQHLVLAELLAATGVTATVESLELVVESRHGASRSFTLKPASSAVDLTAAGPEQTRESPLYLRQPSTPYWFEWLPEPGVVYFQLNQVGGSEGEKLDELTDRLVATLDEHPDAPLVIDLRHNPGGWYGTAKHLLRSLLRRDRSHETGGLIVITGRTTFSAAMMLAIDLEKHSNVLFIGEPTGSSPNHHGDAGRIVLPGSGLTVRISTLYWQAHPSDRREAIEPHLVVEPTWQDYLAGRDPVLEAAFDIASTPDGAEAPTGRWQGTMSFPQSQPIEFSIELSSEGDDGSLRAAWLIPAFTSDEITLRGVTWTDGHLSANTPWQGGNVELVTLDAQLRRGYLVGTASLTAEMGTERLPFVLKRVDY